MWQYEGLKGRQAVTYSLKVADAFSKQHKDVLKAWKKLVAKNRTQTGYSKSTVKRLNELINRNRKRFKDGIDVIDLLSNKNFEVVLNDLGFNQNQINR